MAKKKLVGPTIFVLFVRLERPTDKTVEKSKIKYDFAVSAPEDGKLKTAVINAKTYFARQICWQKYKEDGEIKEEGKKVGDFIIDPKKEEYIRHLIICKKVLTLPTETDREIFADELAKKLLTKNQTSEMKKRYDGLLESIIRNHRKFLAQG